MTDISNTSIKVNGGPSAKSLIALARAAEANAKAIEAIASHIKSNANTYGVHIVNNIMKDA